MQYDKHRTRRPQGDIVKKVISTFTMWHGIPKSIVQAKYGTPPYGKSTTWAEAAVRRVDRDGEGEVQMDVEINTIFHESGRSRNESAGITLNAEEAAFFALGLLEPQKERQPLTQDQTDFIDAMTEMNPILGLYARSCCEGGADPRDVKTGFLAAADNAKGWCTGRFG